MAAKARQIGGEVRRLGLDNALMADIQDIETIKMIATSAPVDTSLLERPGVMQATRKLNVLETLFQEIRTPKSSDGWRQIQEMSNWHAKEFDLNDALNGTSLKGEIPTIAEYGGEEKFVQVLAAIRPDLPGSWVTQTDPKPCPNSCTVLFSSLEYRSLRGSPEPSDIECLIKSELLQLIDAPCESTPGDTRSASGRSGTTFHPI